MAKYELLIHARRAVVDGRIQQAAVTVDGGVISSVRTGSEARDIGLAGYHTIDLGDDAVLMPGLVDPHVSTEDVAVGTRSAALGGITTVVDYGTDGAPVATEPDHVDRWRDEVTGEAAVDVGLWGAAVPGNLERLGPLLARGVFGISAVAAGKGVRGAPTLDRGQLVAAAEEVAGRGGLFAADAGVDDLPQLLDVFRRTGGRLHLRGVADAAELPLLRRAKAEGLPVTASTSPHLLALVSEVTSGGAAVNFLDPPIRDAATRELLWEALRDGTIDAVACARLGLSVVWTEGRRRGFDLADVARWMGERTAAVVGLEDRGVIRPGLRADFAAVADDEAFVVLPGVRELGSADSVYAQRALAGVVRWTMTGGRLVDPRALPLGSVLSRSVT
ncbi:amidohydrolase family protein [Rhodococcus sp. IEGM 1408]|uniref:amidohydrolase family protein n=1 Tax=Rhodococcus sp. IEGM 1408 TaxID=3082220 RepID=UPI0029557A14|nr:amidohydrolase family protein [Rhodococcus sp. IEGM 1408]MDV8002050.1 amidohydrolase family protein [Rhodococcus sp. IEGM 1408]